MIALLAAVCLAASGAPVDPVIDALEAELRRNMAELELPDADRPYFMSYGFEDTFEVRVVASLGGIVTDLREPDRSLGVSVRVGSVEVDNGNFSQTGRPDGFRSRSLVWESSPEATQRDAWLLADRAYKGAVENLGRKHAARRGQIQIERPPEFAPGEGHVGHEAPVPRVDAEPFADLCRELSAVFLEHPNVEWSEVHCLSVTGRSVSIDSVGTRVQRAFAETDVRVVASARADDGAIVWDHASWVVRTPDDLPALDEMRAATEALARDLEAWSASPAIQDRYVGPVLFTDSAAVSLFRELLLPALSGTPPLERVTFSGSVETDGEVWQLKRRILPTGFHVSDDPLSDRSLPSSFAYDDEGVPAQRLQLVESGLVRDLFMSRVPNDEIGESNGHGRGAAGTLIRGRPSNVTVEVDRVRSHKKLAKRAQNLAALYDLDHVLVVRRLADPSILGGGDTNLFRSSGVDADDGLSPPVHVVRLYADGREERVRGLRFRGVDLRTLREIDAAGASTTETFLDFGRHSRGITYGLPTTLTAPAVLLTEVLLAPQEGAAEDPPLLPNPIAGG